MDCGRLAAKHHGRQMGEEAGPGGGGAAPCCSQKHRGAEQGSQGVMDPERTLRGALTCS